MKAPLYLDLETVVDESIPADKPRVEEFTRLSKYADCGYVEASAERLKDTYEPGFASLSRWRIVSFGAFSFQHGFRILGAPAAFFDEHLSLIEFAHLLSSHTLVTWNGRGFDVPLLCLRALALGVPLPDWYGQNGARHRYQTGAHLDVKDYISDFGAAKAGSLNQVARLVGLPGKIGADGSSVARLMAEGRHADVHAYCLTDVAQTSMVERRVAYLRGLVSLAEVREDLGVILARVDEDKRLAELAALIDRPRLLLE